MTLTTTVVGMIVHLTKKSSVEVTTLAQAREVVLAKWAGKKSSSYYRDPVAGVIEIDGVPIAHVSYNGRVWASADRFKIGQKEIV